MDQLNKLLDNAKDLCIPRNDLTLSRRLGVVPSAVSNWRNGRARPDVVACEKLANMTGIKPLSVVAMVYEQRELSRDAKAVWRRLATAATVLLLLGIGGDPRASVLSADSQDLGSGNLNNAQVMHYAKI